MDIPQRRKRPKSLSSFLKYFHQTPIRGTMPLARIITRGTTQFTHTSSGVDMCPWHGWC